MSRDFDLDNSVPQTVEERTVGAPAPAVSHRLVAGLLLAAVVAGAVSAAGGQWLLLGLVVLLAVLGLAAVVLWRFELLVPVVLALRSSLDLFSAGGGGTFDPALLLTGAFAFAAVVWLLVQRREGRLLPVGLLSRALLVLFGVCVLSAVSSAAPVDTLVSSVKVGSGALMFLVLEQYLGRRPEHTRRIVVAVLLSLLVPTAVGLQQAVAGSGIEVSELVPIARVQGSFVHPSPFATYLVVVLALLLPLWAVTRGWWRVATTLAAAAAAALLLLTYTRSAWLAAVLVAVLAAVLANRRLLLVLVPALVLVLVAVPSVLERFSDLEAEAPAPGAPANSLAWRLQYWQDIASLNHSTPMTGIGFEMTRRTTAAQLDPHNIWVQAWVELGALGVAALLLVAWALLRTVRHRLREARTAQQRALAAAGACVALALLVLSVGENLLTQSFVYWYTAAVMTIGASAAPSPLFGVRSVRT